MERRDGRSRAIGPGLFLRSNGHGSTLQEGSDQRAIYLQAAVVANEALLPKPSHKFTYSSAGRTDHLRQGCLAHLQGVLRLGFLGYLTEQQQNSRQSSLAEIEELVHQIFLDSNNPGKQIISKQRVAPERSPRDPLPQSSDIGRPDRSRRAHPKRLPC